MNIKTNNDEKCETGLAALRFVDDPEIGLNIVDLGLVYGLEFGEEDEHKVTCTMTLTTEFCPMGGSIQTNITEALKMAFPGYEVVVILSFDPPWSQQRISEAGRLFLGG
ncbi:MAG: metal-sulfur cluster assembly factor [Flavobacteriales bacterium]|jgi:metal-sulfur cluster biosynthetic enzyme|nr:metal-sulfur cluster assembly factor [Flavobacteriales bacterium]MBK6894175.1 metal-sulfur cluster assembly factor [Flavobacteriales bacterium]MBK7248111.1 metal-sulfur cluster assembly factor [Flavobacteriales bacterium]MBK7288476.1 metal-sulfur cluster assembly factor [Flavobacteriales bacterium]MBK9059707.1 metal-sulfur cluster assembly factor [Flavobacteriales bacterium]